jgi:hypothetical protein
VGADVRKSHPALGYEVIIPPVTQPDGSMTLLAARANLASSHPYEELIRYHNTGRRVESKKITLQGLQYSVRDALMVLL